MDLKDKLQKDKRGLSTIVIVVAIIIIVVAAGAAYVLLSNNSNNDERETVAPGTTLNYEVRMHELKFDFKLEFIGQNADEYFIKITTTIPFEDSSDEIMLYTLTSKSIPEGAKKLGTEEVETIDGKKTLDVWEYTMDLSYSEFNLKAYIDPSSGISYKYELDVLDTPATLTLSASEIKWQRSYKESSEIGKTYEFSIAGQEEYKLILECIADCKDGQYGIRSIVDGPEIPDEDKISYYISNYPQGLPVEAENTGDKIDIDTIDGNINVEIWKIDFDDETDMKFYLDPSSHIIYRIIGDVDEMPGEFNLIKRS